MQGIDHLGRQAAEGFVLRRLLGQERRDARDPLDGRRQRRIGR